MKATAPAMNAKLTIPETNYKINLTCHNNNNN